MSWPLVNFVDGSSVGSWPARSSAARMNLFIRLLPRGGSLLVLVLVDVEEADPRKAHLVDRALAVADPVARVRVVFVRRRVVVPRGDVNDRPGRQNRRHILRVRIRNVPAELIVADAVERLGARGAGPRGGGADVRIDRLH